MSKYRTQTTTNINGLRMFEAFEDLGEGSSTDHLQVLTNPTGNPRDVLIQIVGPKGSVRGAISLDLAQAGTLADWLEMMTREPARFGWGAGIGAGDIADGTRLMNPASKNLTEIVDQRGMSLVFEVGTPPNKIRTRNGIVVERVSTEEA